MNYWLTFGIAFVLSIVGSLPPGMINLSVSMGSIRRSWWAGAFIGLGAVVVEWFQAFIALKFAYLLSLHPLIDKYLQSFAVLIFLGLATYYLLFAPKTGPKMEQETGTMADFFKGMAISSANLLVFPYWIFYGTYMSNRGWLADNNLSYAFFCTGVMLGSLLVYWLYGYLARAILRQVSNLTRIANWVVGVIFLLLGIYQLMQLYG